MKISKKSILAAVWIVVTAIADKNEEQQAKGWYKDCVISQENPYMMEQVRELGKKISKERGGPIDSDPQGWFLEFLLERVRGKLFAKALAARKKGETSTWKLTLKIKFLFKIWKV